MGPNSVENLSCQVQWFEQRQGPHPMSGMKPLSIDERGQRLLAGVTERGMAHIVCKTDCLGEVLIQS